MTSVVGLDLSLTSSGVARISGGGRITQLVSVKSKGRKGAKWLERSGRVECLAQSIIAATLDKEHPDLVVIEGPAYGAARFGSVVDRSMLLGSVLRRLYLLDIPVAIVPPANRAKYGTGKGNAKKDVVQAFVVEAYTPLLDGPSRIANDDEADAILLAAMGRQWYYDLDPLVVLPDGALGTLEGCEWPAV